MDRFRAMGVFVAVANAGSLSGAARVLREPLTNISRQLAQLEAHLGVTLVERTTRRLVLTPEGRDYLETCRRVLEELALAETFITGSAKSLSGDISITAPVGFGRLHVLPVVCEFLAAHPDIDVRLQLVDRVVDLVTEGMDIALRIGRMKDSPLLASRVGSLKLVTFAAPDYLERRGTPTTVQALAKHDCITFAELPGGSRWVFNSKRHGRIATRVNARLEVNSADAVVSAAVAGLGIARVLSYQAQAALDERRVKPLLQRFEDTSIPVALVSRPTRLENSRVREFVRFASSRLRTQLAGSSTNALKD